MASVERFIDQLSASLEPYSIRELTQAVQELGFPVKASRSSIHLWKSGKTVPSRAQLVALLVAAQNLRRAKQTLPPTTSLNPRDSQDLVELVRLFDSVGLSETRKKVRHTPPRVMGLVPALPHALVERSELSAKIRTCVEQRRDVVVWGRTGSGRTTLAALCFASREVTIRLWVDASTEVSVVESLARAAVTLRIPGHGQVRCQQRASALIQWLAETSDTWLVVFAHAPAEFLSWGWWPQGNAGSVLVVSDDAPGRWVRQGCEGIEVSCLSLNETQALASTVKGVMCGVDDVAALHAASEGLVGTLAQWLVTMEQRGLSTAALLREVHAGLAPASMGNLSLAALGVPSGVGQAVATRIALIIALGPQEGLSVSLLQHRAVLEFLAGVELEGGVESLSVGSLLERWSSVAYGASPTLDACSTSAVLQQLRRAGLVTLIADPLERQGNVFGWVRLSTALRAHVLATSPAQEVRDAVSALAWALRAELVGNPQGSPHAPGTVAASLHLVERNLPLLIEGWPVHPLPFVLSAALGDLGFASQADGILADCERLVKDAPECALEPAVKFMVRRHRLRQKLFHPSSSTMRELHDLRLHCAEELGEAHVQVLFLDDCVAGHAVVRGEYGAAVVLYEGLFKHPAFAHLDYLDQWGPVYNYALALGMVGRLDEAATALLRLQAQASISPGTVSMLLRVQQSLACCIFHAGNQREAIQLMRSVVERAKEFCGPSHPFALHSRMTLCEFMLQDSDPTLNSADTLPALLDEAEMACGADSRIAQEIRRAICSSTGKPVGV